MNVQTTHNPVNTQMTHGPVNTQTTHNPDNTQTTHDPVNTDPWDELLYDPKWIVQQENYGEKRSIQD